MAHEIGLPQVIAAIEDSFQTEDLARVERLLWPALEQYPDMAQLWFYGGCVFFKTGRAAVAAALFAKSVDLEDSAHVYSNLGACYRRMNRNEEGRVVLRQGLDRNADWAPTLVNMGSTYVNEGCPEEGIAYLEKAAQIGTERGARWNLGLLYLEAARFGEGFDLYRLGVTQERQMRMYGSEKAGIPEPVPLTPDLPRADKRIIIWGEQGIGDELMFGTMLEEARRDFGEVIFECHPRLKGLHARAHPGLRMYDTRKEDFVDWVIEDKVIADYKCAIGDLACMYRRDLAAFTDAWFNRAPYYTADPIETQNYRAQLEEMANGRPIVGLATHGGVMSTARTYRTIRAPEAEFLFSNTDCLFVCLDYDDMMQFSGWAEDKFGPDRYKWFPSIVQHYDYHHVAALLAATDLNVTVCQSVAHLSAGMGRPTRVLTPKRVAWRYAPIKGNPELWAWYPDPCIKTYRQDTPDDWKGPLSRVIADIRGLRR